MAITSKDIKDLSEVAVPDTVGAVPQKRSYDSTYLFRCHQWQREAMEQARRKAEAELPPGERLSFNDFLLQAAMERVRTLGVKVTEPKAPKK